MTKNRLDHRSGHSAWCEQVLDAECFSQREKRTPRQIRWYHRFQDWGQSSGNFENILKACILREWQAHAKSKLNLRRYGLFSHNVVTMEGSAIGRPRDLDWLHFDTSGSLNNNYCTWSCIVPRLRHSSFTDSEMGKCIPWRWSSGFHGQSLCYEKLVFIL